jgi:hypothetical protein
MSGSNAGDEPREKLRIDQPASRGKIDVGDARAIGRRTARARALNCILRGLCSLYAERAWI